MQDLVSDRPAPITVGPATGATFVTPPIGLPDAFPIVTPGVPAIRTAWTMRRSPRPSLIRSCPMSVAA